MRKKCIRSVYEKNNSDNWSWRLVRRFFFFFFFTLVTGPRRSLSLKLSDTNVYEPQIRATVVVCKWCSALESRTAPPSDSSAFSHSRYGETVRPRDEQVYNYFIFISVFLAFGFLCILPFTCSCTCVCTHPCTRRRGRV